MITGSRACRAGTDQCPSAATGAACPTAVNASSASAANEAVAAAIPERVSHHVAMRGGSLRLATAASSVTISAAANGT